MTPGSVLAWIVANAALISTVLQTVESLAADLQNLHGNNPLDAWLKALSAFFTKISPQATPAEAVTIGRAIQTP